MEYVSGSATRVPFMNPRSAFLPARKRPSQEALQPIKNAPRRNFYSGARIPAELRFRPKQLGLWRGNNRSVSVGVER